jgi:hypothetical protein
VAGGAEGVGERRYGSGDEAGTATPRAFASLASL